MVCLLPRIIKSLIDKALGAAVGKLVDMIFDQAFKALAALGNAFSNKKKEGAGGEGGRCPGNDGPREACGFSERIGDSGCVENVSRRMLGVGGCGYDLFFMSCAEGTEDETFCEVFECARAGSCVWVESEARCSSTIVKRRRKDETDIWRRQVSVHETLESEEKVWGKVFSFIRRR